MPPCQLQAQGDLALDTFLTRVTIVSGPGILPLGGSTGASVGPARTREPIWPNGVISKGGA